MEKNGERIMKDDFLNPYDLNDVAKMHERMKSQPFQSEDKQKWFSEGFKAGAKAQKKADIIAVTNAIIKEK